MKNTSKLPVPSFYSGKRVGEVYRVPYRDRAAEAEMWAKKYNIQPSAGDNPRICLMAIDCQNTFCLPDFELFVGGRSGKGAVDDNDRLCKFVYQNLNLITDIAPTMDTHLAMQIFHPVFWIDDSGKHPAPAQTVITLDDVKKGVWRVNPAVAYGVADGNYMFLQKFALHYVNTLSDGGKYPLMIWPYHAGRYRARSRVGGGGGVLFPQHRTTLADRV
jgi:nicotinamidase-related amidase